MSRLLANTPKGFIFHKRCKDLKLTHLAFADDLLVFCGRDLVSVSWLTRIFIEFENVYGLAVNKSKSELYTCGIQSEVKNRITEILGIQLGNLPVRYLGLPLISSGFQNKIVYLY